MSDCRRIKELLRQRVAELAQYLFPHGHREGNHWCVGSIEGEAGRSFKICIAGEKAALWGDFADSGRHSRNPLDLWMRARSIDFKTALREAAEWTGYSLQGFNGKRRSRSESESTTSLDWRTCVEAFTDNHVERLAKWRGYSLGFCQWLKQNRLVGLYKNSIAFPAHDRTGNVVAVHYRQKGGSWRYYPQGAKARSLVIGELLPGELVHVFESQWDAFAFMDRSDEHSSIIITRGANNAKLIADLLPQNSIVFCWTQNDTAGAKWENEVCANTRTIVRRVKIPAEFKDLNAWTQAGATVDDLIAAVANAGTLPERERSWGDAVNESVVTSNQLHALHLVPRRKLLGDWFAEGDLGILFAFRGVGKTWFALGIATALSTGGRLGEWQAHEAVRVLYIDGEMPADLMRDRCYGLQSNNDHLEFLNHEILFDRTGKVLNITNPEVQQAITQHCVASGIKVLILDNLSTLARGMKENEADSWELVNNWLLDLRRRKVAVVIVHHAGRSGEMRGTTRREDNVFWIIALDDARKNADDKRGARFVSHFTKPSRNTQEEVPAYEWHFVTDKASGLVSIGDRQAQTLDVFRSIIEAGVTECEQIAAEMKVPKYTVSRLAKKAVDAGWLTKRRREYALVGGKE
jgi:putative DNA primase/helicase